MYKEIKIKTKRLVLTEITIEDLSLIHELHSIPEVAAFNTIGIPRDQEETIDLMLPLLNDQNKKPRSVYTWKIDLIEENEFIGLAGMFLSNDKFRLGEIYIKLYPKHWNKGFATETIRALIETGFNKMNLHKVEAGVATENHASIRALEKSGMTREGLRRKILPINGQWKDNYHYAIVEDDPR